ncbi:Spermatogenesis-associated protein 22 [Apodemus speciosus]|uniref:Spermatogenesis-associated protein 22 n=1 Tax=Apodemus speciosus TaxID=105296 RepID=A0ABQ0FBK0_APOSI
MKRNLNESSTRSTAGQIPASASYPLRSQESVYRENNRNTSLRTWDRNDFRPQRKTVSPGANSEFTSCPVNLGAQRHKQFQISEFPNLPGLKEAEVPQQTCLSKPPGSTMKGPDRASALQAFKPSFQQNTFKTTVSGDVPRENSLKEGTLNRLKEKDNSLRIISAVIESMKYWRAQVQKTVLLFEVLADRELPRLIRGRVHRCVGHYDPDKKIFKCVSVRPASASEQKTFQAFVTIVDAEMKYHTKVMNEM